MSDPADIPPPPATPNRLQVPPWVQLVGLPLVVLFGYVFARAASHALIVFLVAGLISLLLAPVVRALVARGLPRLVSVLFVFGAFVTAVTVLTVAAVDLVAEQAVEIRANSAEIGDIAIERIDDLQGFL
ncbi:MAG: family transporter, partial [Thermoleophilia bacterium]|nr:family transporter [Thermoleophilia bacterium]